MPAEQASDELGLTTSIRAMRIVSVLWRPRARRPIWGVTPTLTQDPHMAPIRWQPDRTPTPPPWAVPSLFTALGRGLMGRCPSCGKGRIFDGFLRVVPECAHCGAPLGLARADDAPPY